MLHKPPTPGDLYDHIDHLKDEYKSLQFDNNSKDTQIINLIESFKMSECKEYDHNAAIGACVYGLLSLGGNGELFFPQEPRGRFSFFSKVDHLGKLLQKCVDIHTDNTLDDQQAIIYLTHLYHYLCNYNRKKDGKPIPAPTPEALKLIKNGSTSSAGENLELIKEVAAMIELLKKRIQQKRPTYKAIVDNFHIIAAQYSENGGKDLERIQYTQFLSILDKEFREYQLTEAREEKEWSANYTIRYGAMVYIMEKIEAEKKYRTRLLSPEGGRLNKGSELYKICKKITNIPKSTYEIPNDLKYIYYVDLLSYLLKVTRQPKLAKRWNDAFKGGRPFFIEMQSYLAEKIFLLNKNNNNTNVSLSYLDILISKASAFGVTIALGAAGLAARGGTAVSYFSLFRPDIAIIMTLFAYTMEAMIANSLTNSVNSLVIDTITSPVIITFESVEKLGEYCSSLFSSSKKNQCMELVDSPDLLTALKSLPEELFTAEDKEKMKFVLGYNESAQKDLQSAAHLSRATLA